MLYLAILLILGVPAIAQLQMARHPQLQPRLAYWGWAMYTK